MQEGVQVAVPVRLRLHAVRSRRREARLRVGERGDLLLLEQRHLRQGEA